MGRALAAACLVALAVACGGQTPGHEQLNVFAAASLTGAFEEMSDAYAQRHPGVVVRLNLASSSQLAGQIHQGAPADVFASADERQMAAVADLLSGRPQTFARNRLEIAVELGNPLGISGLADLGNPQVKVVLAGEEAPAGRYAAEALGKAGAQVTPVSREVDVRAVVTKVALGEADAGLVYATDIAAASGRVEGVWIPEPQNVTATYPIAALADAPNPGAAQAFVEFARSREGQVILARHGFLSP